MGCAIQTGSTCNLKMKWPLSLNLDNSTQTKNPAQIVEIKINYNNSQNNDCAHVG